MHTLLHPTLTLGQPSSAPSIPPGGNQKAAGRGGQMQGLACGEGSPGSQPASLADPGGLLHSLPSSGDWANPTSSIPLL